MLLGKNEKKVERRKNSSGRKTVEETKIAEITNQETEHVFITEANFVDCNLTLVGLPNLVFS